MAHVPVGDDIAAAAGQWTFDGLSGDAFSTHVRRSVPIYDQAHNLSLALSSFFVSGTPLMYDIGCSHGSLTFDLAANVKQFGVSVVGIDHSASLLDAARSQYEADNLSFVEADIETFEWQPSALIVSSFTLQFIRPRNRYALMRSLWQSLDWGGGLLLFEKFRAPDARFHNCMSSGKLNKAFQLRKFTIRECHCGVFLSHFLILPTWTCSRKPALAMCYPSFAFSILVATLQ